MPTLVVVTLIYLEVYNNYGFSSSLRHGKHHFRVSYHEEFGNHFDNCQPEHVKIDWAGGSVEVIFENRTVLTEINYKGFTTASATTGQMPPQHENKGQTYI